MIFEENEVIQHSKWIRNIFLWDLKQFRVIDTAEWAMKNVNNFLSIIHSSIQSIMAYPMPEQSWASGSGIKVASSTNSRTIEACMFQQISHIARRQIQPEYSDFCFTPEH